MHRSRTRHDNRSGQGRYLDGLSIRDKPYKRVQRCKSRSENSRWLLPQPRSCSARQFLRLRRPTPAHPRHRTRRQRRAGTQGGPAQRKAEHKAARAKNNAELKKLEDAGYKPAANDPNYPQNLQNAEKKPPALVSKRRPAASHGSIRGLPRASRLRGAHRKQHSRHRRRQTRSRRLRYLFRIPVCLGARAPHTDAVSSARPARPYFPPPSTNP